MATDEADESANFRLVPQLKMMLGALWGSSVRDRLLVLGTSLVAVVALTAYGQNRLNQWNQPFYDALEKRNVPQFLTQLGIFALLAGIMLVLNVTQRWLVETAKWRLREGLVSDLIENWLKPGRAFRLSNAGAVGVNPDQRMHEDARHLTELSADLGVGLLQSSVMLGTFVAVLWGISSSFVFHVRGHSWAIPGYMVWAAVLYSGSASFVSWRVGRTLVARNADRYAREADLRYSLVRVNEHIDAIALASGESDEARRIGLDLDNVLKATRRLVLGLTNLTWITAGYGWFTNVAPILVAAPLYFAGSLSFGGLMLAAGAFIQVQSSLRWFVDNFSAIADWRATLLRVAGFRRALTQTDDLHGGASRIDYATGGNALQIDDLQIASPAGCTQLQEAHVRIEAAERVLIVGEAGAGKTLLFRALAGLWPWGAGQVSRPADQELLYLPRTPYLPPGTLREVLAYPLDCARFSAADCIQALAQMGLERLAPRLDTVERWERELNEDEQQALAFARVALHRPPWLLIDEVLDALDETDLKLVTELFDKILVGTAVIHIGREATHGGLFKRVLHLVRDPDRHRLPPQQVSA